MKVTFTHINKKNDCDIKREDVSEEVTPWKTSYWRNTQRYSTTLKMQIYVEIESKLINKHDNLPKYRKNVSLYQIIQRELEGRQCSVIVITILHRNIF